MIIITAGYRNFCFADEILNNSSFYISDDARCALQAVLDGVALQDDPCIVIDPATNEELLLLFGSYCMEKEDINQSFRAALDGIYSEVVEGTCTCSDALMAYLLSDDTVHHYEHVPYGIRDELNDLIGTYESGALIN